MSYRQLKRTAVKSTIFVELAVIVGVTGFMILNGVSLLTDRLTQPDAVMGAAPVATPPASQKVTVATPLRALSGTPVLPPNAHGLVDPGQGLSAIAGAHLDIAHPDAQASESAAMDALCKHLGRGAKAARWTWAEAGKTPVQVLTGLLRYEETADGAVWQSAPSAVATDTSPVLSYLSCEQA